MDSFYRTIKRELIQDAQYETPEQAPDDMIKYNYRYFCIIWMAKPPNSPSK
jgi:putative transposase